MNITNEVISCIKENYELVGDEVPEVKPDTPIFTGIGGMDSLRAIEVLVDLEDKLNCKLPPEKIFIKEPAGSDRVCDVARQVQKILSES